MKLAPGQIEGFVKNPSVDTRIILVYGPDHGLVSERGETLAKHFVPDIHDPFSVSLLSGSTATEIPSRLMDEMSAQSFMGGRRLVRVQNATEALASALTFIAEEPPTNDSVIVIEAGDLDKRSKLRALCEASPHAVALPCYNEDGPARNRTINDILQLNGIKASAAVVQHLNDTLPHDRLAMRSELDKLALYARGQSSVGLDDVNAVIVDVGFAEIDEMIIAVSLGDAKTAMRQYDRLLAEHTSPVAILRMAQRHFLRLQQARQSIDSGMSANEAIKRLQPPVFWKQEAGMIKQLGRWSATKIDRALVVLCESEANVKSTGTPDTALCGQLFIAMAG